MIPFLHGNDPFPPLEQAMRLPNGLLAAGGELTPARLLDAYRHGIFPWFNEDDPILWWSPDPRTVLFPGEFKISRTLRKTLRSNLYEVRTDTVFDQVMQGCAAPRGDQGTWINADMIAAYKELHRMGHAHSVETWQQGVLVGGLYGVSIGRMFYGESMFSRRTDASKVALAHLAAQLRRWNFGMIDCQMRTSHLVTLGAREISRSEFSRRLQELVHYPDLVTPWQFDHEPVA
ncbi:MAG: leucyl/phenylalanyl-tRNA--protein transferase [Pseudomonadota bacterium]